MQPPFFSMCVLLDTMLSLRNTENTGVKRINFSFIYRAYDASERDTNRSSKCSAKHPKLEHRGEEKETISEGFCDHVIKKVTFKQHLDWWVGVYPNTETGEKDSRWGLYMQRWSVKAEHWEWRWTWEVFGAPEPETKCRGDVAGKAEVLCTLLCG